MKYKVGDKIKLKTWKQVKDHFNIVKDKIVINGVYLNRSMFYKENKDYIITNYSDSFGTYKLDNGKDHWYPVECFMPRESKTVYRIKTEEEFVSVFGVDWREDVEHTWLSPDMDELFGRILTAQQYEDAIGSYLFIIISHRRFTISIDMVIKEELPIEEELTTEAEIEIKKEINTLYCSGQTYCDQELECHNKHSCTRYTENRYIMVDPKYNFMKYAPFDTEKQVCKYLRKKGE